MKRPFSVVATIIIMAIWLVSNVSLALANISRATPALVGLSALFACFPIVGIAGLLRRSRWARAYNSAVLVCLFLLVLSVTLLNHAGKPDIIRFIPPLVAFSLLVWLAYGLAFGKGATKYFSVGIPPAPTPGPEA